MKFYIIALCFCAIFQAKGQETIILEAKNAFPEGVAFSKTFDALFMGSVSNRKIYRYDLKNQKWTTYEFLTEKIDFPYLGMKEKDGNLYVATGPNGTVEVYDIETATKVFEYKVPEGTPKNQIFVNDLVVGNNRTGYLTDSYRPVIYSFVQHSGVTELIEWLDLSNSPITYKDGYNLNGITLTEDESNLLVIQTNTGKLFKISIKNKSVKEIKLSGDSTVNGDGIVLIGSTLYAVRNGNNTLCKIKLNKKLTTGKVTTLKGNYEFPTSVTAGQGKLFILNSQIDKMSSDGNNIEQFTIKTLNKF